MSEIRENCPTNHINLNFGMTTEVMPRVSATFQVESTICTIRIWNVRSRKSERHCAKQMGGDSWTPSLALRRSPRVTRWAPFLCSFLLSRPNPLFLMPPTLILIYCLPKRDTHVDMCWIYRAVQRHLSDVPGVVSRKYVILMVLPGFACIPSCSNSWQNILLFSIWYPCVSIYQNKSY